jgi:hypothetical protein
MAELAAAVACYTLDRDNADRLWDFSTAAASTRARQRRR